MNEHKPAYYWDGPHCIILQTYCKWDVSTSFQDGQFCLWKIFPPDPMEYPYFHPTERHGSAWRTLLLPSFTVMSQWGRQSSSRLMLIARKHKIHALGAEIPELCVPTSLSKKTLHSSYKLLVCTTSNYIWIELNRYDTWWDLPKHDSHSSYTST